MKMIRKGEYDLVNISLIGFDPVTGRSYDECHAEWRAEFEKLQQRTAKLRWWQLIENIRCRWRTVVLTERLGM